MSIVYDKAHGIFKLDAKAASYVLQVTESGHILHLYYGRKISDTDVRYLLRLGDKPFTPSTHDSMGPFSLDVVPMEYPCSGIADYREPCLQVLDKDGMSACELFCRSHSIYDGKPGIDGLPATFAAENEAQTLELCCIDPHSGLQVTLIYTVFADLDVITRSVRFQNTGESPLELRRALSACVDLDGKGYDMITLYGAWARERHVQRSPLHFGKQQIDSLRGASSHAHNPFVALCAHTATEDVGEVYGFNLVYSGNFLGMAEVTPYEKTRFVMGINPYDFGWLLKQGEELCTPEVVMVYSGEGIGGMSRTFHDLYRKHLIRGRYKDTTRPILVNNWEATYFDFDTDKLLAIARDAAAVGIEMLVMDDGWFGHRSDDHSSLGDWSVNVEKITGGMGYLAAEVNKLGMKLGLWFEPEMVSPDSDLYRAHPDWCLHVNGRTCSQARSQLVLDMSRAEVREHIYGMVSAVLKSANIEYVKWDMNRQLTEVGNEVLPPRRQRELWHRYMLGVYELQERLITDFPHILLENCAGGGGRFDAGMLYYSPQIWTSDDTDAMERLKIQHGTSLVYPISSFGSHVSDVPNHTVGRVTPFATRGHVALVGSFGYELDVTKLSLEDKSAIAAQVADFHKYNELIRKGDFYRIGNPFANDSWDCWCFVAKDQAEALLTYVQVRNRPNFPPRRIRLMGLDPNARYRNEATGEAFAGDTLMNAGVDMPGIWGDAQSCLLHFTQI